MGAHIVLRDYQISLANKGLEVLKQYGLVYLCLEVRCGKTLTSFKIASDYGAKKVLFITKKKAIGSIQADFEGLQPGFELYVINYEQLGKITAEDNFDLFILDEAHCISQFPLPAKRTKELKRLCDLKPIIYLSGTPTAESYSQIYHQFYVSSYSPFSEYKTFYAWAKHFVTVKAMYIYNRQINDYSNANKQLIDSATAHLFLSYSQKEAGFTQFVHEEVLTVKMKPATYALADRLRKHRVYIGKNGGEVVADTEVKLMQKLHQIYSGTVLLDNKTDESICFDDTKALYIRERFKGQKIAIFYKFRAEYIMLLWAFKSLITDSPEEFNKRDDLVFVSQVQSGREGINLSTADALIMFNIDFSSLSYSQAKARLQTLDRDRACNLFWIFSEGGIESKIYDTVIKKQDYTKSYFLRDFNIQPSKKVA